METNVSMTLYKDCVTNFWNSKVAFIAKVWKSCLKDQIEVWSLKASHPTFSHAGSDIDQVDALKLTSVATHMMQGLTAAKEETLCRAANELWLDF